MPTKLESLQIWREMLSVFQQNVEIQIKKDYDAHLSDEEYLVEVKSLGAQAVANNKMCEEHIDRLEREIRQALGSPT